MKHFRLLMGMAPTALLTVGLHANEKPNVVLKLADRK